MYRYIRPTAFAIALMVLFSGFAQCAAAAYGPVPQTEGPVTCNSGAHVVPSRQIGLKTGSVVDHGRVWGSGYYEELIAQIATPQELREVIQCLALLVPLVCSGVFLFRYVFPEPTPAVRSYREPAQGHDNKDVDFLGSQTVMQGGLRALPAARKPASNNVVGRNTCPYCGFQVSKAYNLGFKEGKLEGLRFQKHHHTRSGCNCHGEMRCMVH